MGAVSRIAQPSPLRLGAHTFGPDQTLVMAIVIRTPDSFYDGGATMADDDALAAIDRAVAAGADIVDIGGVKAGPGAEVDADAAEWLLANDIAAREPKPVRTPTDPSVDLSPIQRKEPKQ